MRAWSLRYEILGYWLLFILKFVWYRCVLWNGNGNEYDMVGVCVCVVYIFFLLLLVFDFIWLSWEYWSFFHMIILLTFLCCMKRMGELMGFVRSEWETVVNGYLFISFEVNCIFSHFFVGFLIFSLYSSIKTCLLGFQR